MRGHDHYAGMVADPERNSLKPSLNRVFLPDLRADATLANTATAWRRRTDGRPPAHQSPKYSEHDGLIEFWMEKREFAQLDAVRGRSIL